MGNFSSYIIVSISRNDQDVSCPILSVVREMYRLFWYKLCKPDKTSGIFPSQGGHSVQTRGVSSLLRALSGVQKNYCGVLGVTE